MSHLWCQQAIKWVNCSVFIPVFTGIKWLQKSPNKHQSYSKKQSGTFFMAHSVKKRLYWSITSVQFLLSNCFREYMMLMMMMMMMTTMLLLLLCCCCCCWQRQRRRRWWWWRWWMCAVLLVSFIQEWKAQTHMTILDPDSKADDFRYLTSSFFTTDRYVVTFSWRSVQ